MEAILGSRPPVVPFVGVQNQDVPRKAVHARATIVEPLNAADGVADGIGIVPMRIIGVTREKRFDPFQAGT